MVPPQFSVFEYLERYLACLDDGRFRRMQTYGNEWQELDRLCERGSMAVAGLAKAGFTGRVAVLLVVVVLARTLTRRSYTVEKK